MNRTLNSLLLAFGIVLALGTASDAQWLSHLTTTPQTATNAFFPNALPGTSYFGPVTATVTNITPGPVPGVPGIAPNHFANVTSGPGGFLPAYSLDPNNKFEFLNVSYNDNLDKFTVTIDFSHLFMGYLPMGSLIAFLDVDIGERVTGLSAIDMNGNSISGQWLSGQLPVFDYDAAGGGVNPANAAAETYANGAYNLLGKAANQTAAFQGFSTLQNIRSLSFICDRIQQPNSGSGGYGIAIGDNTQAMVPEPNSVTLAAIGAIVGWAAYWVNVRKSKLNLPTSRA